MDMWRQTMRQNIRVFQLSQVGFLLKICFKAFWGHYDWEDTWKVETFLQYFHKLNSFEFWDYEDNLWDKKSELFNFQKWSFANWKICFKIFIVHWPWGVLYWEVLFKVEVFKYTSTNWTILSFGILNGHVKTNNETKNQGCLTFRRVVLHFEYIGKQCSK